jgi:hypothetical protein
LEKLSRSAGFSIIGVSRLSLLKRERSLKRLMNHINIDEFLTISATKSAPQM